MAEESKIKTTATKPLYDGLKSYKIGDPVEVSKKDYDGLVKAGAIKAVADKEPLTREQELEEMTVPVLTKLAEDMSIDTKGMKKANLITAILIAEKEKAD